MDSPRERSGNLLEEYLKIILLTFLNALKYNWNFNIGVVTLEGLLYAVSERYEDDYLDSYFLWSV